jgi:hypothetical protein
LTQNPLLVLAPSNEPAGVDPHQEVDSDLAFANLRFGNESENKGDEGLCLCERDKVADVSAAS